MSINGPAVNNVRAENQTGERKTSSARSNVYKVVVMGPGGCGKSAISISFVSSQFVETYDPTIEDSYRRQMHVDDRACVLDILDTAGQEEYGAMRDQYMRTGEGFLLVYDVTQRASFDEMKLFRDQIERATDQEKLAIVVAGNKCDLPAGQREVSEGEGRAAAEAMGARFLETSAKLRINIDEVFAELVRQVDILRGDVHETPADNGQQKAGKMARGAMSKLKRHAKAGLIQKKCALF